MNTCGEDPVLVRWKIRTAVATKLGSSRRMPGDEDVLTRKHAEPLVRSGFLNIVGPVGANVPIVVEVLEQD